MNRTVQDVLKALETGDRGQVRQVAAMDRLSQKGSAEGRRRLRLMPGLASDKEARRSEVTHGGVFFFGDGRIWAVNFSRHW